MPTPRFLNQAQRVPPNQPTQPAGQGGDPITIEVIEDTAPGGMYVIRGVATPHRESVFQADVGDYVYVQWRGGRPFMILNLSGHKGSGTDEVFDVNGIVEELFVAPDDKDPSKSELWFRNFSVVVNLKVQSATPQVLTGVKWGADRKSFVLQTDSGASRKWNVFKFTKKKGDRALNPGQGPGPLEFVRQEDPFHNAASLLAITSDRQEMRASVSAKWLTFYAQSTFVGFFFNPAAPATGLGVHSQSASCTPQFAASMSALSTQHTNLSKTISVKDALSAAVPGVFVTIADWYLDKDLSFVLSLLVGFDNSLKGDGTRTRGGTQPKLFVDGVDDPCELITEPGGTAGVDLPTLGPVTNLPMSDYLAERHAYVFNHTTATAIFKTTRPAMDLVDENDYALPAMGTYNPVSPNRYQAQRHRLITSSSSTRHFADGRPDEVDSSVTTGCGPLNYEIDPEGTDYTQVLNDLLAFQALGDSPPEGGGVQWINNFYNLNGFWPGGNNSTGVRRARADLWNHALPWIAGGDAALDLGPLPNDPALLRDYGLVQHLPGFEVGVNGLANPVTDTGFDSFLPFIIVKYSTEVYVVKAAIPTSYRVTDSRVLTFGAQGYVWLALEKVVNSGTLASPVWAKSVGVYVVRFDGTLVSNPLPWSPLGVSIPAIPNYLKDPFQNFYDDGTTIEMLADGPKHVLWATSTQAERAADADARHMKLTRVADGKTVEWAQSRVNSKNAALTVLGIDFLYNAAEPKPKGRKFIKGWKFKDGDPTLDDKDKNFPVVDMQMTPLAGLKDLAAKVLEKVTFRSYHGIHDKGLLQSAQHFVEEPKDQYPTT